MAHRAKMTLDELGAAFASEVLEAGGELERSVKEEGRLYVCAHLPYLDDLGAGDFIGAGIAMRASRTAIGIHPYVVRQACITGLVLARVLDAPPILFQDFSSPESVEFAIGQAVRVCSARDVFDYAMDRLRSARRIPAFTGNFSIDVSLMLNRPFAREFLDRIMQRVSQEGDDSAFGLANGVASVARDLVHPEDRWQLELLGGEIAVLAARGAAPDTQPSRLQPLPAQLSSAPLLNK